MPANFAISVFIDRIDEYSTADVRSYDTKCCGNVADVRIDGMAGGRARMKSGSFARDASALW